MMILARQCQVYAAGDSLQVGYPTKILLLVLNITCQALIPGEYCISCCSMLSDFQQVVWANSRSVGCGAFRCSLLVNGGSNWVILVCNYGPA